MRPDVGQPGRPPLWILGPTLISLVIWPGFGRAQPADLTREEVMPTGADYDQFNSEWNGLTDLKQMLLEMDYRPVIDEPIDLSQLSTDTPIVLIYPRVQGSEGDMRVDDLLAYLEDGGRLLLADDFGEGGLLASALGLYPRWGRLPHRQFFRSNDQLPIFWVTGTSELVDGVVRVVANHPVALESDRQPVIPYDEAGHGLLYDVSHGRGRAIVLADPSLFINFMLDVADNRRLVRHLFEALCPGPGVCAPRIDTREVAFIGRYTPRPASEQGRGWSLGLWLEQTLERIDGTLGELTQYRPTRDGLLYASVVLVIGISVFLFILLPLNRPRWLAFRFTPPAQLKCRSEYERNLEWYGRKHGSADWALPLAIVKEEFEDLFYGELARHRAWSPAAGVRTLEQHKRVARWFADRVAPQGPSRRHRDAYKRALSVLKNLERIPSRDILVPQLTRRFSSRQFTRLFRETQRLLQELGLWEEYERRFGKPQTDRS